MLLVRRSVGSSRVQRLRHEAACVWNHRGDLSEQLSIAWASVRECHPTWVKDAASLVERVERDDVAGERPVSLSSPLILRFPSISRLARFEHATVWNRLVQLRIVGVRLDDAERGVNRLDAPTSRNWFRVTIHHVVRLVVRQLTRDSFTKQARRLGCQVLRRRKQVPDHVRAKLKRVAAALPLPGLEPHSHTPNRSSYQRSASPGPAFANVR
jgi:hypothetical protein